MATELGAVSTTGKAVYAVLRNSAAQVYRTDTHVFEAETDANYAQYAIVLAEQGTSGVYFGTMPNTAAGGVLGDYNYVARLQLGGAPALGDPAIGTRDFSWSGSAVLSVGSVDADVLTRLAATADPSASLATLLSNDTTLATNQATLAGNQATMQTTAAAVKAQTDKLLFDGANNVKSTPQTAVALSGADETRLAHLDADVSTRLAATADPTTTLAAVKTVTDRLNTDYTTARAGKLDHLDVDVGTRLATSGYTAPDNSDVATILSDVVSLLSSMATDLGDQTSLAAAIAAIKAQTDLLHFTSGHVQSVQQGVVQIDPDQDWISGSTVRGTTREFIRIVRAWARGKSDASTDLKTRHFYAYDDTTPEFSNVYDDASNPHLRNTAGTP